MNIYSYRLQNARLITSLFLETQQTFLRSQTYCFNYKPDCAYNKFFVAVTKMLFALKSVIEYFYQAAERVNQMLKIH